MVYPIMKEYLRWFGQQMELPTLLLMDNFGAHEKAVEMLKDGTEPLLRWTRIAWLPPNATSLHQTLDQGII